MPDENGGAVSGAELEALLAEPQDTRQDKVADGSTEQNKLLEQHIENYSKRLKKSTEDTTEATPEQLIQEYTGVTGEDLQRLLDYAPPQPFPNLDAVKNYFSKGFPVLFKTLPHYAGPEEIAPATPGSAGVDLYSANSDPILLNSMGSIAVVPTGLVIELPVGFEAQIRSRSGLAKNHGIVVLNSPGTVDSDYRGEIGVILVNSSNNRFKVERGMKIAQMVINQLPPIQYVRADELSETERGAGGFGSTGL